MSDRPRAAELHAAGVAATNDMRPALGARRHRAALRVLDDAPPGGDPAEDAALRARILVSLAYAVSELGRIAEGLGHLDEAERLLPPQQRGTLHGQRAVMLRRTGRDDEALAEYGRALRVLDERREPRDLARVLLNRAVLHLHAPRPAAARADLGRAAQVAQRHGFGLIAAKARHNLALLDLAAGDLPRALGAFAALSVEYTRSAPGVLPLLGLDRARVLLAAGLFREADDDLAAALARLRAQGMGQDEAEALLARAEAALLAGRHADARRWAGQARSCFLKRRNGRWAALADLVDLRAAYATGGPDRVLLRRANTLAARLSELALDEDARVAGLLAARANAALGRTADAVDALRRHGVLRHGDRLDTRVLGRLARAEVAAASGRAGTAARQLTTGLAELHRYRAQVGCLDLQTGAAVHGRDLAGAGLRRALDRGRPAEVFAWAERSRAQALLLPPVRPPADPETAAALAALRQVRLAVREAERAGRPAGAQRSHAAELERRIRHRSWTLAGPGTGGAPAPMGTVAQALGDAAMAVYLHDGPALRALVLAGGTARLVDAGRPAAAAEIALRLRASLDARAGRALPPRLADAVLASVRRDAAELAAAVLGPVLAVAGDRDLVLVPTGELLTVPWSLLPGAAGRPVTVAASATSWYTARQRAYGEPGPAGPALLVAGPGNDRAEAEVHKIARCHPGARVLTGPAATAAATLAGCDGAALLHVAAHGRHQGENALFSAFELADGPLMGYDLQQLSVAPRVAVLSACELGLADVRPGHESVGLSTALIAAGTATVVASVSRVADDVAMHVMTGFHRRLAAGAAPAAALAAAAGETEPAGFVCFGAG
ncbi:CHAT domain-containing protein [Catellatospora sp. IY07-71]|uniref:CHAT domain-containing protein n=1 Tax=Catellatospora sp. IY07-71 TaxID=2728827 RepID=UPI001BB4475C|nr:CHAT domain-containing protein [Catellatospora sp. IY07-71]BCJ74905.1 CHAT domain-containing protein [Catellatospora sp. IY07-71]